MQNNVENFYDKDKEVSAMPSVDLIECEKIAYINGMKEYLQNLKSMSKTEAIKVSRENLVRSKIIEENGNFTERYEFTRLSIQKKRD